MAGPVGKEPARLTESGGLSEGLEAEAAGVAQIGLRWEVRQ